MVFRTTTEHDEIRRWIEERDGQPVVMRGTENSDGILQIDFSYPSLGLEAVSWDEFFDRFEIENLAFVFTDDAKSEDDRERSFRFVDRDTAVGRDTIEVPDNEELAEENTFPSAPAGPSL
jgi:hypothetical protein